MNIRAKKPLELAATALAAALFAGSVAHIAARALGISIGAAQLYLAAACASVPVAACYLHKWAGLTACLAGLAALAFLFRAEAASALSALTAATPALSDWGPFAAGAGSAVLALLTFALCRSRGGAYPAFALLAVVLVMAWELDADFSLWRAFPALIALCAMLAGSANGSAGLLRALLPSALIAALLATLLVPSGRVVYPPLEQAAQTARAIFEDYFRFTHSRVAYSLYMDGYKPLGEALGGPATPDSEVVMRVESEEDVLYLRGSIRDTYTGAAWTDDSVKSRYLFIDPIRLGVRAEIFETHPENAAAFREVQASIEFLDEGTSTLFVPHRVTDIEAPVSMAIYFNTAGEVFLPRDVEAGDAYSFTALAPEDEAVLAPLSGVTALEEAEPAYTQLPASVDARVYELAASITAGAQTDYAKAAAIRDYLQANYAYTLEGAYVDPSQDFVSAFLFDLREGYCTYFASAMAVLARAAGLQSRYVEGYRVSPEGGIALVTGLDAHAWAEVYVAGLGWLVFEATPGGGEPSEGNGAPEGGEWPEQEPTPTPTPAGGVGIPTPTPDSGANAPTPTPSPTPPSSAEGSTPSPSPGAMGNTPTPPPSALDTPTPPPPDSENDASSEPPNLTWLWWLLSILALLALAALGLWRRLRSSEPALVAASVRDKDVKLLVWYRALLGVFAAEGQFPDSGESPAQFAHRMRAAGLATETFERFAAAVMAARYAGKSANGEQLEWAAQAYAELLGQLRPRERARYIRARLLHGLGDLSHIP